MAVAFLPYIHPSIHPSDTFLVSRIDPLLPLTGILTLHAARCTLQGPPQPAWLLRLGADMLWLGIQTEGTFRHFDVRRSQHNRASPILYTCTSASVRANNTMPWDGVRVHALHMLSCSTLQRRNLFKESSAVIAAKVEAALQCGLSVNVTVGETAQQRAGGVEVAAAVVVRQLWDALDKGLEVRVKLIMR